MHKVKAWSSSNHLNQRHSRNKVTKLQEVKLTLFYSGMCTLLTYALLLNILSISAEIMDIYHACICHIYLHLSNYVFIMVSKKFIKFLWFYGQVANLIFGIGNML